LRLACLYFFRPGHELTVKSMLDRLDSPPLGLRG
jgi:hypothetical protein